MARARMDLAGDRYGHLLVLSEGVQIGTKRSWICLCDCGNGVTVLMDSLRSGNTKSCGCIKPEAVSRANLKDIIGQRFGRLAVISRAQKETNLLTSFWLCKCDCGKQAIISSNNLRSGVTKSCGCLKSKGKSAPVGVSWNKQLNKWKAYVNHGGKLVHLGYFEDKNAAARARGEAEKRYKKGDG